MKFQFGKENGNIATVFLLVLFLVFIVFSGIRDISLNFTFVAILALGISIVTFINPNLALIILIFSMFFSPEFKMGDIPGRAIVFRMEDLFLLLIFFSWIAKTAIHKEIGLLKSTPLNRPILAYMAICLVSTAWGILHGYSDPSQSLFYVIKYFEYFMIYFMVVNCIKTMKQVNVFIVCLMLTCVLVCRYALIFTAETSIRASAPFEGAGGESNTLGGYLLLMMAVTLGLLIHSEKIIYKVILLGSLIVSFTTFIFTLSRGAWGGFPIMYLVLVMLTKRKRIILLLFSVILFFIGVYYFKDVVSQRVSMTFEQGKGYGFLGKRFDLDLSAMSRINNTKLWMGITLKKSPLLGLGIPGGGIVGDTQYVRVFREVGIIGFFIFVWMNIVMFRTAWRSYIACYGNSVGQGLSIGLAAGLAGLWVQGIAAETYIIIRIMEPFWFLMAIVVSLPEIIQKAQKKQDNNGVERNF